MSAIYTAKKFAPSAIGFAQVERNKLGGKYVPLTDENGTKRRFTIQTPTMHLPFGVGMYREKPDAEPSSYSVDVSFRGYETDDNVLTFFNKINELDNHLIDAAYTNSVAWFGKQKSRELLADTYRPLTKGDASGKYAPVMKIKIPLMNGKPNVQVFDTDKTAIDLEKVQKGSTVKVICEVASVWFVGGTQWGVTFRALQVLVVSKPSRISDFAFEDDEADAKAPSENLEVSDEDDASVAMKFL